jgi:hypothetical protein
MRSIADEYAVLSNHSMFLQSPQLFEEGWYVYDCARSNQVYALLVLQAESTGNDVVLEGSAIRYNSLGKKSAGGGEFVFNYTHMSCIVTSSAQHLLAHFLLLSDG